MPFQHSKAGARLLLQVGVKRFITVPFVNPFEGGEEGKVWLVTDHAAIGTQPAGTGENYPEFGNRFYDISTMHNGDLLSQLSEKLSAKGIEAKRG